MLNYSFPKYFLLFLSPRYPKYFLNIVNFNLAKLLESSLSQKQRLILVPDNTRLQSSFLFSPLRNSRRNRTQQKSVESLLARHAHFEAFAMPFPNHNKQLEVHAEYANCPYGSDTVIIHIQRTFTATLRGLEN